MKKTVHKILKPLQNFLAIESSSGILLAGASLIAFVLANSPAQDLYFRITHHAIQLGIGRFSSTHTLTYWVNDALMVLFFFIVGMEIKRELLVGELNSRAKALMPAIAACGGAIVPALIFLFINREHPQYQMGWGIPMATDIAFAVGALAILGSRIPPALKVFLLALAIADDLIAILVIAFFYTQSINATALLIAALIFIVVHFFKVAKFRRYPLYFLLGGCAWLAVFASGVHATIAGVILGLMTPLSVPTKPEMRPIDELIHKLHPLVSFLILPLFAFLNAGVVIKWSEFHVQIFHPISLGIMMGLVLGKPVGIGLCTYIVNRLKWAPLPTGTSFAQMVGVGVLSGIGFTMSLFVASLSYSDPGLLESAKIGILVGSIASALVGLLILSRR